MKKGIKTWKLWYLVVMHILAIIGGTGIVMFNTIANPGIWNWFLLIILSFVNYIFFNSMFKLIDRIIRRKNRML